MACKFWVVTVKCFFDPVGPPPKKPLAVQFSRRVQSSTFLRLGNSLKPFHADRASGRLSRSGCDLDRSSGSAAPAVPAPAGRGGRAEVWRAWCFGGSGAWRGLPSKPSVNQRFFATFEQRVTEPSVSNHPETLERLKNGVPHNASGEQTTPSRPPESLWTPLAFRELSARRRSSGSSSDSDADASWLRGGGSALGENEPAGAAWLTPQEGTCLAMHSPTRLTTPARLGSFRRRSRHISGSAVLIPTRPKSSGQPEE